MRHGIRQEISAQQLAAVSDEELRYPVTITWSDEDRRYIARVHELPGCMADGLTYEAAAAEARKVMRLWLYVAREEGRAIPQPSAASAA